ncbi:C1 family peptidase 26-29-p [Arctopsyche grandis]|uniref:C1 family peptidase 26-29-p n=1 Tax=Arctopsyche grandis TaxID=121162 RepID=UPI00406D8805
MLIFKILPVLLLVGFTYSDESIKAAPVWNNVYTVKGVLSIPYAELMEPFYAWYDSSSGRSRVDYYGGMVKTYQLSKEAIGDAGTSIKVAPVTTEQQLNIPMCLQVNGTSDFSIQIQSVLPDLTGFKFIGTESINGENTQKWRMEQTIGEKNNKYTIWIKYKKPSSEMSSIPIPVRYEMKGFNSLLGSHYDHYYLDYDEYNINDISPEVFAVENNMTCVGFPGPGAQHIYTFNPMMEFVHPVNNEHVEHEFNRFMKKHKKTYGNTVEHSKRKNLFRQNMRYIHSKNREHLGYSLTVNHLTDRSELEMKALRGRRYTVKDNGGLPFPYENHQLTKSSTPKEFDWRLYGAVTPVKDQSVCGSCWSFGTVGAIEGALFLHNGGSLTRLSQQALVDCSWGFGNNGCDGGEDFRAYQWMMKHGGIPTEDEYGGYLGQDGYCHADNVTLVAPIKGYVNVTSNNENALRLAIFKHGPISVAIDASHKTFSFYSHGVYYEPKCGNKLEELDHAVLAVGYGTMNGEDFWLVKNSWSNYWGNDGYVLMSAKNNNCGVQTTPTYVVM